MANDGRHTDRDGIVVTPTGRVRTGVWLLLLALALVAVMLVVVIGPFVAEQPRAAMPQPGERVASGATRRPQRPAARPAREPSGAERPRLPAAEPARVAPHDDAPASSDEAEAAPADEEPSGIALFPPPGTDPIKPGIVVPDDFELPPGFVRHYQTTDNGQQLPPILMFHPDYQPVDEEGEQMALPADRVVPPQLAPAGMPQQMLEVPDDTVPMVEGPNDRPAAD